ncbi:MAG: M6 family metalloprotease domain-containing protein [Candidatus ainarchaeum sp.]|nr:M6 family metalloprotease domain-containing protein [Candidatus ainarchaeum sp.]MDD3975588.1 M6 family metalloprotease domain-containing protein [Candidatus ainarchaeum sp.]
MKKYYIFYIILIISFFLFSNYLYAYNVQQINISEENNNIVNINPNITINLDNSNIFEISQENIYIDNNFCQPLVFGDISYTPDYCSMQEVISDLKKVIPRNKDTIVTTVENVWGTSPLEGNVRFPIFMVEFSDKPHDLEITPSDFEALLNSENYLDGSGISVNQYYLHESYGDLNLTFDVYDWVLLPHTYEYYSQTSATVFELIPDTIEIMDSLVDFSQYDSDNDGRIDGIGIIRSGTKEGFGLFADQVRLFNGTTNYSVQGLYYGNTAIISNKINSTHCQYMIEDQNHPEDCRAEVIPFTHEFAHILGLPDLYAHDPFNQGNGGVGLGSVSMMSNNYGYGNNPINFDSWSKMFLGWLEAEEIDSQDAGIYDVYNQDQYQIAYVLKDETKMNDREYFLVENRFASNNTQDKYLFGSRSPDYPNYYGGIVIYHVDENQIEYWYPYNAITYDPDGIPYDDTLNHPGLRFETNTMYDINSTGYGLPSLYTTEYDVIFGISPYGKYDNLQRLPLDYTFDTTSHTYNNLQDTEVVVEALSESGEYITAYLQSRVPYLATISSPIANTQYNQEDIINFISDHQDPTGEVICEWIQDYDENKKEQIILSSECNFSATPQELNIMPGNHLITLIGEDEEGRVSSDELYIKMKYLDVDILTPENKIYHAYKKPIIFTSSFINNIGETTCVWEETYSDIFLSSDCNFIIQNPYFDFNFGVFNKFKNENLKNIFLNPINFSKENKVLDLLYGKRILKDLFEINICDKRKIKLTVEDEYGQSKYDFIYVYFCKEEVSYDFNYIEE